jgi:predicted Zn-dependent peptidase
MNLRNLLGLGKKGEVVTIEKVREEIAYISKSYGRNDPAFPRQLKRIGNYVKSLHLPESEVDKLKALTIEEIKKTESDPRNYKAYLKW